MQAEEATGTRNHILAAAEQLIRDRGLTGATTRAIAERAGCAEGSIYRYFTDKHALFHELVQTRFPEFIALTETLPARAGTGSVRKNLEEIALAAVKFYRAILPMVVGAMGDHELLVEQRRHFEEHQGGPMKAIRLLSAYLGGERRLGRISARCSPDHGARLLLGTCFAQASLEELVGEAALPGNDQQFARAVVRNLMEGLEPRTQG